MADWSDSEDTKPNPSNAGSNDDWGSSQPASNSYGGERRGGGGRGRGGRGGYNRNNEGDGSNNDWGSSQSASNSYGDENRRGRGGGRGRGGRGGFNRDNEGGEFRPRRRDNDENDGGEFRPRRRDNEENGDGEFRPRRRDNEENDGTEQKKPEIYIPPEPTNDETELFGTSIAAGINFDLFDKIQVKVSGEGNFTAINSFEESGLRDYLLQNIRKSGYTRPMPIQKHAIPIIMQKRDMMACAQTGSGKTAAFVLPILNSIMADNSDLSPGKPQCLIVAPTRELVIQIFEEARKFALGSWVKVCLAYGGAASMYQSDKISSGCHILVATPGRLMDFVGKGVVAFNDLKFLVLDEADRMLDMGFRDTIQKICEHETIVKDNITTLMFSATFPQEIQQMAGAYLKNYVFLAAGIVGGASTDVEQEFMEISKFKKRELLREILDQYAKNVDEDRILVFVETKRTADYLASLLSDTQISSTSIHGDRTQQERELALREFRKGIRKVLIATAVAARGLDIKGVTHVINYDLPKDVDEYVHRIGRTGRVGNRGKATSFYDPEVDAPLSPSLVNILKQADQPIPAFFSDTGDYAGPADEFGGSDIRRSAPIKSAIPQAADEDW